jgi:hypothetical protein
MLIPYDAGAASEGTQEIPTHGIPSPRHSPGAALSVDSAAALMPIAAALRPQSVEEGPGPLRQDLLLFGAGYSKKTDSREPGAR